MLKAGNFLKSKKGWKSPENQRKFLDTFARSKKFNPMDAENWHYVTHDEIVRAGGSSLVGYYNGSLIKALVKLYPELQESLCQSREGWKLSGTERKLIDQFAIQSIEG